MSEADRRTWVRQTTADGVSGWFVPDGAVTPPMSACQGCGYLMEAERRYSALCKAVNRAGHGINGVSCGTDGYDEKRDSILRAMRRKDADFNRRKAHLMKYGDSFRLLDEALAFLKHGVGDRKQIVSSIERMKERYRSTMEWDGCLK